jgi:hypothetical protein
MNFDRRKAAIADMSPSFATLVILPVILRNVFMENSNDRAASIEATSQLEEFCRRTFVISPVWARYPPACGDGARSWPLLISPHCGLAPKRR